MSGKGFGLTSQPPATLVSTTFTANGNWIAPASTTNVVTASGKGAAGVSDYPSTYAGQYYGNQSSPTQSNAPYAQWSTIYNSYLQGLSQVSALSYPGYGPSVFNYFDVIYVDSSNRWTRYNFSPNNLSSTYITSYYVSTLGTPPTSGNMIYSSMDPVSGWGVVLNTIAAGGAGASATALGQTFPGGAYSGTYPNGTGSAATTTTFSNIAVTPNASYPIVVPSGGFVTLEYYV